MTYAELVVAVTKLPAEERRALLEVIARSLREERRAARPAAQVRGLFRTADPPPSDADVEDMYSDYLVEKYR